MEGIVAMGATLLTGLVWLITVLIKKAKHEDAQDTRIKSIEQVFDSIGIRIDCLESGHRDNDLIILSIKERVESLTQAHETTQGMILRLQDNQKEIFNKLIERLGK